MQRKKIDYSDKVRSAKLSLNKQPIRRRGTAETCLLEVKIPGLPENKIVCVAPVEELVFSPRNSRKSVRKGGIYRIAGKEKESEWGVAKASMPFRTPEKLINSPIMVTDGKRVLKGTILKASIVGGGATSPPSIGGLPPVDE